MQRDKWNFSFLDINWIDVADQKLPLTDMFISHTPLHELGNCLLLCWKFVLHYSPNFTQFTLGTVIQSAAKRNVNIRLITYYTHISIETRWLFLLLQCLITKQNQLFNAERQMEFFIPRHQLNWRSGSKIAPYWYVYITLSIGSAGELSLAFLEIWLTLLA